MTDDLLSPVIEAAGGQTPPSSDRESLSSRTRPPSPSLLGVPIDRSWHAVSCFPTISEVWLRLMQANHDTPQASTRFNEPLVETR